MAKDKNENRFIRTYKRTGFTRDAEIWLDTQTGVNYFYVNGGYGGGITPLLDKDGKPVITPISE